MFSNGFSMRPRRNRTWSTPWSTPPSSRSTATDRAQKGTQSQAIGRSKGGMTTKILVLTDSLGNLVRFVLVPGHRFDTVGVAPLIDAEIYKWRHLIENFFCKLKEFKRIAMRADKTDQSFAANIHLAAALINSR